MVRPLVESMRTSPAITVQTPPLHGLAECAHQHLELPRLADQPLLAIAAGIGAARINRLDRRAASNAAFTVVARGEFALILVALATQAGLDERLTGFIALYVLILAIASPVLAVHSETLARLIPRALLSYGPTEHPVESGRTDIPQTTTTPSEPAER
jgi:hypothetical protein